MKPIETTAEALSCLAEGSLGHVCLISPGHFAVIVTFDHRALEFVFAEPWLLCRPRLAQKTNVGVAQILFQTQPTFLGLSSSGDIARTQEDTSC